MLQPLFARCRDWLVLAVLGTAILGITVSENTVQADEPYVFHHEYILGTSLELQIDAATESEAEAAEARILTEIERLSRIFSTYHADSEFSRWQRSEKVPTTLSPELVEMLAAADHWRTASAGAFEPAITSLHNVWKAAEQSKAIPTTVELQPILTAIRQPHWRIDAAGQSVTRLTDVPLTLNAIAKGAIVEWASRIGSQTPGVHGLVINLGGDLRISGDTLQVVRITDPLNDAVNAPTIERIFVSDRAVATSGNYRRGYQVGDQWYSHILDPRTGQPAGHVISATVVAKSSADADALATICNVLPVSESLRLINAMTDVDALVITVDGQRHASQHWQELRAPGLVRFASAKKSEARKPETVALLNQQDEKAAAKREETDKNKEPVELLELTVKFELSRPSGGAQYRRPYVAVWLEDADEFPVRTAVLWMTTKQPGPRWHRDLLRWFRNDGIRKLADNTSLIDTIAGATRGPGEYKAVFDGRDDNGKPLKPGNYTLYLEAAREHGTYQLIRHKITLGKEPIAEKTLKGNAEFKATSVEYKAPVPKETAKPAANAGS